MVGFTQPSAGAVNRTTMGKLRDTVSVKDFGATGDGVTNDTAAIQAAVNYAATLNAATPNIENSAQVLFPAGAYIVKPATLADNYAGAPAFGEELRYGILMKSNVNFIGQGATIKVDNDVSSREIPRNFAVFYSEAALNNILFDGLTIDLNSPNNYFSPYPDNELLSQEDRYFRYHQAAIFWEGASGKADDVTVQNCTFRNGNGVSTIICGRLGSAGVGRRWRILNCNFLELGLDTYDHSSIFLWCDDAQIRGCFWRNAQIYAPTPANRTGVNAPIEAHGSNTIISENVFENCNRGSFITENGYSRVEKVQFIDNVVVNAKYCGVDVAFDGSGGFDGPKDIRIAGNIFGLSGDDTNLDGDTFGDPLKAGRVLPCAVAVLGLSGDDGLQHYSPIDGLVIEGNRAHREASANGRSSNFIAMSLQADGFDKITFRNNECSGFTRGVYLITDSTTAAGQIECYNNRWLNPEGGTLPGVTKVGTLILAQGGAIGSLYFSDTIVDTRGTNSWSFGIVVTKSNVTAVREFYVGRDARFDDRMTFANQISGVHELLPARVLGVAVSGTFFANGYDTLSGASVVANAELTGVKPTDQLVVGYDQEVVNAGEFLLMPFYSGANEVSLAVRNVTGSTQFIAPGFTFRITAYPGR